MKVLLSLFLCALLGACSSVPSVGEAGKYLANTYRAAMHDEDVRVARAIDEATSAVSLRAPHLSDKSLTLKAMQRACEQGRFVELLTHISSQSHLPGVQRSCVRVYASADPALLNSRDVLVLAGQHVWVDGQRVHVADKVLRDEFLYWQYAKRTASLHP